MVAVVTDGTAVLGLGDIGPEAALPVMEGKAVLFKYFAGADTFPICLATKDPDKIVEAVTLIAPSFGGINLEDISGPRCFEIEAKLKERLDIPVFHDDQHGTAVIVLSGLINVLKTVGKKIDEIKVVVNGAGAVAITMPHIKMYLKAYTMPQVEMYSNLLEGSSFLSIDLLLPLALEAFNLRSLFCNLVIFLFSSAGFSIAYWLFLVSPLSYLQYQERSELFGKES